MWERTERGEIRIMSKITIKKLTAFGAAGFAAGVAVDDGAAAVEFELAAVEEHLLELSAAALDAGFGAGEGNAEAFGECFLREALELGEDNGVAVTVGQAVNHAPKSGFQPFDFRASVPILLGGQ